MVILYSGNFPGTTAGAKRVDYYKRGLIAAGIEVDILPISLQYSGRITFYISSFLIPFRAVKAFFKVRLKYKSLLIYGFNWTSYFLLIFIARLNGIKVYLEINEKYGTVYGNRITEFKLLKGFNVAMTRLSYFFFDGFVVISSALEHSLKPYTSRGATLIKIPIIIDLNRNHENIKTPNIDKPYMLHTGALSDRKDGITEVFAAFAIASKILNNKLHFYLTSQVAPKEILQNIRRIIEENDLQNNIHFLGDISEELLLSYQKFCSLVIINKHYNDQNKYNFPSKLGEYLVFETPVITTGVGEMGEFFLDGENAFVVPVNNVIALAEKIVYAVQYPDMCAEVGKRGMETAALYFNYLYHGKRLAAFLKHTDA
jgi:glycosyltransferase involved in cell wall biosynthesis